MIEYSNNSNIKVECKGETNLFKLESVKLKSRIIEGNISKRFVKRPFLDCSDFFFDLNSK